VGRARVTTTPNSEAGAGGLRSSTAELIKRPVLCTVPGGCSRASSQRNDDNDRTQPRQIQGLADDEFSRIAARPSITSDTRWQDRIGAEGT
jgi:hypothetical protein